MDRLVAAVQDHGSLTLSEIEQAGEHGADSGWSGFTYTSDGAEFTRANMELVWSLLSDEADEFGNVGVLAHVATFNRADMAETRDGFDCLLAWWALETAGRYLADSREERHEAESDRMRDLGEQYGRSASTWLLDGNSTDEAAERLLRGILEGDPEIMDALPSAPFSGEWADGPTIPGMLAEADVDDADELEPERSDELATAFEDGYGSGVQLGAEEEARSALGITTEHLGDCGSRLGEVLHSIRLRADGSDEHDCAERSS